MTTNNDKSSKSKTRILTPFQKKYKQTKTLKNQIKRKQTETPHKTPQNKTTNYKSIKQKLQQI